MGLFEQSHTRRAIKTIFCVAITLVLLVPPGLYLGYWVQARAVRAEPVWDPWLLWIVPYLLAVMFLFTARVWVTLVATCGLSLFGIYMIARLSGV